VYHKPADYVFLRRLSRGAFGTVFLAKFNDVTDTQPMAIKVIGKNQIRDGMFEQQLMRERSIMAAISKAGEMFVHLKAAFQTRDNLYMVMEYVPGGDCCSLLLTRGQLSESTARFIVAEVASALSVLHSLGYMHRDIKPDNILFTSRGHVKLADFGMAAPLNTSQNAKSPHIIGPDSRDDNDHGFHWQMQSIYSAGGGGGVEGPYSPVSMTAGILSNDSSESGMSLILGRGMNEEGFRNTVVGNVSYASPESVIGAYYNQSIDWWALGVLIFHLICGKTPFEAPSSNEIIDNILNNRIRWTLLTPSITASCRFVFYLFAEQLLIVWQYREFITALLRPNHADRLGYQSGQQVIEHPYFQDFNFSNLFNVSSPVGINVKLVNVIFTGAA
jgi:serine/threonine protein kinase